MLMGNKTLKNRDPDTRSSQQKEDIQAEQIVVKITDQGYVTSHGDHFHYYNGKVPLMRFSVKNFDERCQLSTERR